MRSTNNASLHVLTPDEIEQLVQVIADQCGAGLTRQLFTDEAMMLLDQVPGLETLPSRSANRYVSVMWTRYLSIQRAFTTG